MPRDPHRPVVPPSLVDELDAFLEILHSGQVTKARNAARRVDPRLTAEDLLNPQDFPATASDPAFAYEDGIAAGILAAKIAVRAFLKGDCP